MRVGHCHWWNVFAKPSVEYRFGKKITPRNYRINDCKLNAVTVTFTTHQRVHFYYLMLQYVRMSFPFILDKHSYKGQRSDMIIYERVVGLGTRQVFFKNRQLCTPRNTLCKTPVHSISNLTMVLNGDIKATFHVDASVREFCNKLLVLSPDRKDILYWNCKSRRLVQQRRRVCIRELPSSNLSRNTFCSVVESSMM